MAPTPQEIEQVLEQVRAILSTWRIAGTRGEIAIVVGEHQYQPEERPRIKHPGVKREQDGNPIVRVG